MAPRRTTRLLTALLAALLAIGVGFFPAASPAAAVSYVPLDGDGSSWAEPAIQQWSRDIAAQDGIQINYTGDGSAQGRENFIVHQNDFAGSDIAFLKSPDPFGSGTESVQWNYSYIPIVAGGTTFIYNLHVGGRTVTDLRLSGQTLAKIFTGSIVNWDDPAITHDYGAQLPNEPITVVTRSDGSGASYMFTRWLAKEYPSLWNAFCAAHGGPSPCGPTEFYPGFANSVQKNGSDQMASFLASPISEGAIGYDEYAYALNYGLHAVKMLNAAGYYTLPTPSNVAIALQAAVIDENPNDVDFLMQDLDNVYTNPDPRAYPLSSYSYLIIPRDSGKGSLVPGWDTAKGVTLSTWLNYVLCGAQQTAGQLGYSPLPKTLVVGGFEQVDHLPGHIATPDLSELNGCNNPTYSNGVNHLIKDAPYPSQCDYETAPLDCTAGGGGGGTGGGTSGNGGTSGGSGGSGGTSGGSGGTGGASASAGAHASTSAGAGSGAGGGSGGSGGGAGQSASAQPIYAEPVAVASRPDQQTGMAVLTVLLIIGAVGVPVFAGARIQRRRKRG
ncbi:substrate-binding domain-containing protein [Actinospica durhamensis]|uniref:Substrate-binding domain-containing protein n=1 Tax=Actinospica durhamensis TaxID=1508375 RepID=A0A941ESQ4_9ACTN|nr:substrate-binding domain-containing protein [Actinospica durhamensis]MBR7836483.1 substrate-binding domain-containing protein [Actinospica durhamensis]